MEPFQNTEYFDGIIRINHLLFILNGVLILHFIFSWWRTYKKTGWKIDFWHFTVGLQFVVPVFFMYPFIGSPLNIGAMGNAYYRVEPFIGQAYLITILGYVSLIIGTYYFETFHESSLIFSFIKPLTGFSEVIYCVIRNSFLIYSLSLVTMLLLIFLLFIQIRLGYLGNPRAFVLANSFYRPYFNFIISLYPLIPQALTLRYLVFKKKADLVLFFIIIFFGVFTGSRGTILYPLVSCLMFYVYHRRGVVNLFSLSASGLFFAFNAMLIGYWRDTMDNFELFNFFQNLGYRFFYGNAFSDTRDFAWILAYWDNEFVMGKTYLAGLLSFIPSYFSDFRSEWAIGKYVNNFVGFDTSTHAGLRPGSFGEAYFNFGGAGVILLGFLAGYVLKYADKVLRFSVECKNDILLGYSLMFPWFFFSNFYISAGFWSFYVYVILFTILYVFLLILPQKNKGG